MAEFAFPVRILPMRLIRKYSFICYGMADMNKPMYPRMKEKLTLSSIHMMPRDYFAALILNSWTVFIVLGLGAYFGAILAGMSAYALHFLIFAGIVTLGIHTKNMNAPVLVMAEKSRSLDRNLLSVLRTVLVQLNSGLPLFNIFVYVAGKKYGAVSEAFKKAVSKINAGHPETEVLEEMMRENPSDFFQRSIRKVVNGMKAGFDLQEIINDDIESLTEEQMDQVQKYGASLNPMATVYLMMAIIVPSLGLTFFLVMASFLNLGEKMLQTVLWGVYAVVILFQFVFMGMIKSKRPALLGEDAAE